nr:MAG TPA: hypothetical protein [Bacteriophage sp.]DAI57929.1 MAG TPA: hypothetical protein [Caudoviricetes sp.]
MKVFRLYSFIICWYLYSFKCRHVYWLIFKRK